MKKVLIAMFALLICAVIPSALAMDVEIKGETASKVSVLVGETVPIKVASTFSTNYSDVVLYAELYYGHSKEASEKSEAIDVMTDARYVNNLDLVIPSDIDVTAPGQVYTLRLELVEKSGKVIDSKSVDVTVQKSNDVLQIQRVYVNYAKAGEPAIITVIAKNVGTDNQSDVYAMVSIPELGVVAEERMGDLTAIDTGDDEDTAKTGVQLFLPADAEQGTYDMDVEVYNDNVDVLTTQTISIEGSAPAGKFVEIVPTLVYQDVGQGETATYSLRVANLGSKTKTYSISVEGTDGWASYQVTPLVFTISPESSQLVTVGITVKDGALTGEHNFVVKASSDEADKSISLTANVKGKTGGIDALLISVIVLAVVLVILIVALVKTRKSDEVEAEESYY
jgi:hypothetical protein